MAFKKHKLHKLGPKREPKLAGQIEQLRAQIVAQLPAELAGGIG
jgi:hypothetical protein